MAFTEFYCQNGGSNLNGGSDTNNAAKYTSTNGNWSTSTNNFTPTDGTNPVASGVAVGDFASVYIDGASVAVYIARITAVTNAANGAITLSSTVIYGTAPTTSISGRTIKVGGAWKGPNGASFPFAITSTTTIGVLTNSSVDQVRVNFKNDQTYTQTGTQLNAGSSASNCVLQCYGSSVGDGSKAIFSTNLTSVSNFAFSGTSLTWIDAIFVCTGLTGSNDLVACSGSGSLWIRCVFHGGRGAGFRCSGGTGTYLYECEAYDDNKSNTSGSGGFVHTGTSGPLVCLYCYSHDHASGSNADAYRNQNGSQLVLINSIADTASGNGATKSSTGAGSGILSLNSNFYNNAGDAINFASGPEILFLAVNNNFTKNSGKAVNATTAGQGGFLYNNGRGSGTEANGSGDVLKSIVNTGTDVTYASNASPYNAGPSGDFSTVLAAAISAGRGAFTETDGTNTGTVGYPDIGAAPHLGTQSSQKSFTFGG